MRPSDARNDGSEAAARSIATARLTAAFTVEPLVTEAEVRSNRSRAQVLAALGAATPALVLGAVLGLVVSPLVGGIAFAAVVVVGTFLILRVAASVALWVVGARPVADGELARLQNLIDGLCPTFGVRRPRLMVLDDPLPNACSVGSRPDHGILVVTTGLDSMLDLIDLEGVVGHELAHLKRCDTMVSGVAVAVLAPLLWMTGRDELLHRMTGRGRELRADLMAVRAVRYPPGLRHALETMAGGPAALAPSFFGGRRFAMTRWIWIDPSIGQRNEPTTGDLDLTSVRIETLSEL